MSRATSEGSAKAPAGIAAGQCLCGKVRFEIDIPARWAWHDHSRKTQHAQGAAYATYVGSWRSRFRFTKGAANVTRFNDAAAGKARSFCARCGTPVLYERAHSPEMVNIPRALFDGRTGREPLYHIAIGESPEWAYRGQPLRPLKGFPGVVWERPRRKRQSETAKDLSFEP
ncbi:MAG: GFA family protein [Proteobacteria bacterium]|nr:GFA family protein [Pseudomonadota bacterium]MBI3498333.1 GFA family protein [Pseudomonadota bacterium]